MKQKHQNNSEMKKAEAQANEEEGKGKKPLNIWDCGSPLYDSFELASLSHLLDRHMMVLPYICRSARNSKRFSDPSTEENKGLSEVGSLKTTLSEFVEKNMSRRWISIAERTNRNAKATKKIKALFYAVRNRFSFWKK